MLFETVASAAQPVTFGFALPAPPYDRWNLTVALPIGDHFQVFAEGPGIRSTTSEGSKYEDRYGAGVKFFPVQELVYVGGGWWTPDAYRFDENNDRYDIRGGLTWLVGLRIFAEAGATADLRYDGFGGYSAGLGLSF